MKTTVYMHICPNGKKYIGITTQKVKDRWHYGTGYKHNKHFMDAIKKYGWHNIEHKILYENIEREQAWKIEKELIKKYKTNDRKYGYNKSTGGDSGGYGVKRNHSKETIEKIRNANLGKRLSKETKERMSISKKGHTTSELTRLKIGKAHKGMKHSKELKIKFGTPIRCVETGIIYYSQVDAALKNNLSQGNIHSCCNGKRHTTGGYHWEYI